jgi:hypothetical protein
MQFGGAVLDLVIVVNSLDLLLTPLWRYSLQFGGAVLDLAIEVLGLCSHSFSAVFVLGQTEGQCSEACSHQPSLVTAFSGLWRQEKTASSHARHHLHAFMVACVDCMLPSGPNAVMVAWLARLMSFTSLRWCQDWMHSLWQQQQPQWSTVQGCASVMANLAWGDQRQLQAPSL